jgi:hypothetical protein
MTDVRPAFRKPWTFGAKAYEEADTFEALRKGMARRRKLTIVKMPNTGEAGNVPCASCGALLNTPVGYEHPDDFSTWKWIPSRKAAYGQHYICSWESLFRVIANVKLY